MHHPHHLSSADRDLRDPFLPRPPPQFFNDHSPMSFEHFPKRRIVKLSREPDPYPPRYYPPPPPDPYYKPRYDDPFPPRKRHYDDRHYDDRDMLNDRYDPSLDKENKKLWVGGGNKVLSDNLTDEVRELFSRYGGVIEKKEPTFAFVTFDSHSEALDAMYKLDGQTLSDGTRLRISFSQPEAPPHRTLYLRYLPPDIDIRDIKKEFSKFGEVDSIDHMTNRGMAFVKFARIEDSIKAKAGLGDKYSIQYYVKHYKEQVIVGHKRKIDELEDKRERERREREREREKEKERERRRREKEKEEERKREREEHRKRNEDKEEGETDEKDVVPSPHGSEPGEISEKKNESDDDGKKNNEEKQTGRDADSTSSSSSSSDDESDNDKDSVVLDLEKEDKVNGVDDNDEDNAKEKEKLSELDEIKRQLQDLTDGWRSMLDNKDEDKITMITLQKQVRQQEKEIAKMKKEMEEMKKEIDGLKKKKIKKEKTT